MLITHTRVTRCYHAVGWGGGGGHSSKDSGKWPRIIHGANSATHSTHQTRRGLFWPPRIGLGHIMASENLMVTTLVKQWLQCPSGTLQVWAPQRKHGVATVSHRGLSACLLVSQPAILPAKSTRANAESGVEEPACAGADLG